MNDYLEQAEPYLGSGITAMTRSFDKRHELIKRYSFAIPTDETIRLIASHTPLLEVGAGSGYWASLLTAAGADIMATDLKPGPGNPYKQHQLYSPVLPMPAEMAIDMFPNRALLIIWPDYNKSWTSAMLEHYLKSGGRTILYIGEGPYGCTADDRFHEQLEGLSEAYIEIPQWPGLHDGLFIYQVPGTVSRLCRYCGRATCKCGAEAYA